MLAEYTPVEYTTQTYTVICYYDKEMMPRKISRFAEHHRALNKVKQSLLTGQHAEIIAEGIDVKEVKRIMAEFKEGYAIPAFTKAIPGKPLVTVIRSKKPYSLKPRTRTEIIEGVKYQITKMRCVFAPGVK